MAGLTALTIPRTGRFDAVRLRLLKACRLIGHVTRRSLLPAPTAFEAKVIKDLRTEGVHVTSLDVLFPDASPSLFGAVNEVAALLDGGPKPEVRSWFKAGYSSLDMAASELVARFPDLYLLGLQRASSPWRSNTFRRPWPTMGLWFATLQSAARRLALDVGTMTQRTFMSCAWWCISMTC